MPTALGLPNWRVVLWFPVLVALVVSVLIALQLSGTSSGVHWFTLGTGPDPRLVSGVPRPIRSDEWLVQQGWLVSQAHRGYPVVNHMFPGGTDMTVLNELPSWDWSSLFRPHLWGYLLFGLNVGIAWEWWIPALALMSSCYLLLVTVVPKRPMMAAFIAVGLFFTPFIQWWYTASTLWCIAWPLLAMAGIVWVLKDNRLWVRVTWSAIVGYTSVALALGLYFPYIFPGILVFLAFGFGFLFRAHAQGLGFGLLLRRLIPFLISGVGAVGVVGAWALLNLSTIEAVNSTVYPGQRSLATGLLLQSDPRLIGLFGAPWSESLKVNSGTTPLGLNSSEAAAVLMLFAFVLPGLIWFAARSFRRGQEREWLIVAILACFAFVAAYLFVPGWDRLADVLQISRIPAPRFRIVFVVLLPVAVLLVVDYLDRKPGRRNWIVGGVCGLFAALITLFVWHELKGSDPQVIGMSKYWKVIAVLSVLAVALFFTKRGATAASAMFLVCAVLMGWGINPLYRGVYDLTQTTAGKVVQKIDSKHPGAWVAVGSDETMAIVDESDVSSYSGVQDFPTKKMWHAIDPTGKYEYEWNRLGHIMWAFGSGPLKVTNPSPDVIYVTMNPCGTFAQNHVTYILSDSPSPNGACLVQKAAVKQGLLDLHIYKVVPPGTAG
jgi:hypothetical protein